MLNLRPYQTSCLEAIKEHHSKGQFRQLISLPTGSGKTVVFANLIKDMGCRALVLAHTQELLEQAKDKINMICPLSVGLVNQESKDFQSHVVISSIQSANYENNLSKLEEQNFGLLIVDEAHKAASDSYKKVISRLTYGRDCLLVGFTATAFRNDQKGLGEVFEVISYQRTIKEMIEEGYLCKPRGIRVATDIDLSSIKSVNGDFETASLAQVMDTEELNEIVVKSYIEHAQDMPSICFGVTVQHARNLAEIFQKHGVSSKAIFGEMPREERAQILAEYAQGIVSVLCNCQILTEGFDAPQTACVIVARPTRSKGLYQQICGRGLRLWPNKKECLILDFGDKNHSICNMAILLRDPESELQEESEEHDERKKVLACLPPQLNQKLKLAILSFDPLGQSFNWTKEGTSYFLKGAGKARLEVVLKGNECYKVTLSNEEGVKQLADGLSFEYAFSSAEDYAKENRRLFTVSDKEAEWRNLPISDKQKACIQSFGFKKGLEGLTRGQASYLIASGALRRK